MTVNFSSVSIVIATFNSGSTIKQCLDSCLEQNYTHKEIIVIDAGSADGTKEVLASYASKLAYWISEPDGGIYHAWNKGLKTAAGEWICFIGGDDVWSNASSLSNLMKMAIHPPVNVVCARI